MSRLFRIHTLTLALLTIVLCKINGKIPCAADKPKEGKYLIGLQLYSVRDDCAKDLPGVLKAVAKMGYTGVEFAGYYGRSAQELRQMLDENGLKCYGTHIGLDTLLGNNFRKKVGVNWKLGNQLLVAPALATPRRNCRHG